MDDPKVVALLEEIRNNQLRQIEISQSAVEQSRSMMEQQQANLTRARGVLRGVVGLIAFLLVVLLLVTARIIFR